MRFSIYYRILNSPAGHPTGGLHLPYAHARLFRGGKYDAWLHKSASEADQGLPPPQIADRRRKIGTKGAAPRHRPAGAQGQGQDRAFQIHTGPPPEAPAASSGVAQRTNVPG